MAGGIKPKEPGSREPRTVGKKQDDNTWNYPLTVKGANQNIMDAIWDQGETKRIKDQED